MTIIPLYKAILSSLGCVINNDGLVSMDISGLVSPVNADGRRLVIPSPERLRFGDWSETTAFHPLSENLVRGESPVLQVFKNMISIRVHIVVHELLHQLITLGFETHRHSKLSPRAQEVLSAIPDVDQKSVDAMINLIENAGPDSGSNRLVGIFLKRNGLYRGNRYARVARVSFPLLEQFETPDQPGVVAGVKLRRKDFQNFQNLIQYIFPDALDMDKYSAPSTSMVAPNFDALLQAFLKLARRLNQVVETHREHLEEPDKLLIDTSWEEQVADLTVYNGQIPSLSGNEGVLLEPETASKPSIATTTPGIVNVPRNETVAATPPPPSLPEAPAKSIFNTDLSRVSAPTPTPQPPPAKKSGGIDFNAAMEARARAASGFHPTQSAPAPAHYPQPMQYPQVPQYAGPAPVQYHRGLPVANYPTHAVPGLPPGMHPANAPAWMMTNDSRIGIGTTGAAPLQTPNQGFVNPAFVNTGYGNPGFGQPVYGQPAWGSSAV